MFYSFIYIVIQIFSIIYYIRSLKHKKRNTSGRNYEVFLKIFDITINSTLFRAPIFTGFLRFRLKFRVTNVSLTALIYLCQFMPICNNFILHTSFHHNMQILQSEQSSPCILANNTVCTESMRSLECNNCILCLLSKDSVYSHA